MTGFVLPAATLWLRECVRFYRDRVRAFSSIVTAVLFWVLIGFGLGGSFSPQGMPPAWDRSNTCILERSSSSSC